MIDALEAVRPGCARFVGGCVRNALMGRPVDDIDIATQLPPERVMAALGTAGLRAIPTGIGHGTVTAVAVGQPFEITTLRRDVETDGRRAVVAFTEDWAEDAARRDFRLNALYAEPDGTLHDPTGGGLADAASAQVIFIGDPDQRLREDYLRILRFFRFNAWYGAAIDAQGLAACARQKAGLGQIAAERIWKEFRKLLAAPHPEDAVAAMQASGVLHPLTRAPLPGDWRQALRLERDLLGEADPLRRLMAISPPVPDLASHYRRHFRLSNAESQRLDAWLAVDPGALADARSEAAIRRIAWRLGEQAVLDCAITATDPQQRERVSALASTALTGWERPVFPLGGEDARAAGLSGPDIGRALKAAETAWVDSDFTLDREALQSILRQPA